MTLPSTPITEAGVIGGLIAYPSEQHRILEIPEDYFYTERNRKLYKALRTLYEDKGMVDIVSLESKLSELNFVDAIGGTQYITTVISSIASDSHLDAHIEELSDYAIRRGVIAEAQSLINIATQHGHETVLHELTSMSDRFGSQTAYAHSMLGRDFLERERAKPRSLPLNIGCSRLAEHIYHSVGLNRGQIKYTLADSGHGKSRFALYEARKLMDVGNKVHWFQLEDYGSVTLESLESIKDDYLDQIIMTDEVFAIEDICREARKMKREFNTDFIVVDYVQNVDTNLRSEKHNKVEHISRTLARLAIELNVVVHVTSQVTLDYNSRKGWALEPRSTDGRWSQQIKQDSHLMASIFRPYLIEQLAEGDYAKDPNGDNIHRDSVFLKQIKARSGALSHNRIHFIDTTLGLTPIAEYNRTHQPF